MTMNDIQTYANTARVRRALQSPEAEPLDFSLLGQGEYNRNYLFTHPVTGQKLVLRKTTGSQMHLADQIGYEYGALEVLRSSGRTPGPVYLDSEAGILVEEFLPGRPMAYREDLSAVAECLARIHDTPIPPNCPLLAPEDPIAAMLAECREMAACYFRSPLADPRTTELLQTLLERAEQRPGKTDPLPKCILNTELNSGNFLVDEAGTVFLVDWEKPILGEAAQDLGHFLAPTTTCWKTDVVLSEQEKLEFLKHYHASGAHPVPLEQLVARTGAYEAMNCLRGVTWSAMAWVEYQDPDRPIRNPQTFQKIRSYLHADFLEGLLTRYFA